MRHRSISLLAFALACASLGPARAEERAAPEGLVRTQARGIDVAYVRPGADWRKYRTILILPLSIPPEARDGSGGRRASLPRESFILRDSDVADIQASFDRKMREEFTKDGRYTLVTVPQADTLIIATSVAQLVLAAPIERTRANYAGRGRTFTSGSGAASLAAVFADGGDYTVLASIADNRYGSDMWEVNDRSRNLANMNQMFSAWGRAIRDRLEAIQDGRVPAPGS